MKQFFANFGFVVLSILGAYLGFEIINTVLIGSGSTVSDFLNNVIGGLIQ